MPAFLPPLPTEPGLAIAWQGNVLTWRDPLAGTSHGIDRRPIHAVVAEVAERWMCNVDLPASQAQDLLPESFLEPELVGGKAVLALCIIAMRNAAPDWAPLALGPASTNCALRLACRHRTTGDPCVWIAGRHSDSRFAPLLSWLGFPEVSQGLATRRCFARGAEALLLTAAKNQVAATLWEEPAPVPPPTLFADGEALDRFLAPGRRSYSPGPRLGTYAVIDLHKESTNRWLRLDRWRGVLRLPWGDRRCDGIYRTTHGRYRWTTHGLVDEHGRPVES